MKNQTKPKSEATPATRNTGATMPFPTTAGPLWLGLAVIPLHGQDDVLHHELMWLRDIGQAERICADRVVLSVVIERAGVRVSIDYANESFKDFIESCADELIHNEPIWDDPAEETLTKDAVRFLSKLI